MAEGTAPEKHTAAVAGLVGAVIAFVSTTAAQLCWLLALVPPAAYVSWRRRRDDRRG